MPLAKGDSSSRPAAIALRGAVKTISEIVGHCDIRLTQNIYKRLFKEAKQRAATAMDSTEVSLLPRSR